MKQKKYILGLLCLVTLLACVALLGGCAGREPDNAGVPGENMANNSLALEEESVIHTGGSDSAEAPASPIGGLMRSSSWAALTLERHLKETAIIVHGTVTGRSEPFWVENEHGARDIYIDYFIEVHEILRGATDAHVLTVRVMGDGVIRDGDYDLFISTDFVSGFELGDEYILFLTEPLGPFVTPGYYYSVRGHDPRAVFRRSPFGLPTWGEEDTIDAVLFYPQMGGICDLPDMLTLSVLREMLVEINATVPVETAESFRQQVADELWAAAHGGAEIGIMGYGSSSLTDKELERLEADIADILAPPPRAWIVEE